MKVGVMVMCDICERMKKPVGRSGPLGAEYCTDDCRGYWQPPYVGSLWPGESDAEFGYPVGNYGFKEVAGGPAPQEHRPQDGGPAGQLHRRRSR